MNSETTDVIFYMKSLSLKLMKSYADLWAEQKNSKLHIRQYKPWWKISFGKPQYRWHEIVTGHMA
jgi:hypothetical protein